MYIYEREKKYMYQALKIYKKRKAARTNGFCFKLHKYRELLLQYRLPRQCNVCFKNAPEEINIHIIHTRFKSGDSGFLTRVEISLASWNYKNTSR